MRFFHLGWFLFSLVFGQYAKAVECLEVFLEISGDPITIDHPSGGGRISRAQEIIIDGQRKIFKGEPLMSHQAINNELAAALVANKLGFSRVLQPTLVSLNGRRGVLFDRVEGKDIEQCNPRLQNAIQTREALEEAKIFDFLIANGDRGYGPEFNNALLSVGADGMVQDIYLIDHHSSFHTGTGPRLSSLPPTINKSQLSKLRNVSEVEWREALNGLISDHEMTHFLLRRNQLLEHFGSNPP